MSKDSLSLQLSALSVRAELGCEKLFINPDVVESEKSLCKERDTNIRDFLFLIWDLFYGQEKSFEIKALENANFYELYFKDYKVAIINENQKKLIEDLVSGEQTII